MTNIHIGDNNSTFGANSPIRTSHGGSQDGGAEFQALIRAVRAMREQVPVSARQIPDEFLELADSSKGIERHKLHDALLRIGAAATMVGQVGVPVIDAIERVRHALGI